VVVWNIAARYLFTLGMPKEVRSVQYPQAG